MSFIQNLFTSRDNSAVPNTYVGQLGRIWYNSVTNSLYISDGITPGGWPLSTSASNASGNTGEVQFNDNNRFTSSTNLTFDDINGLTASRARIGNISIHGDTVDNIISNSSIHIGTVGSGNIVFNTNSFDIYTTTNPNPVLRVSPNGDVRIRCPDFSPTEGGLTIVGTDDGNTVAPGHPGAIIHSTGQNGTPSRIYNDGVAALSVFGGRRYNGSQNAPTQVVANDVIARFSAYPYNSTGWPTYSTARLEFKSLDNQTDTNQGTNVEFWATAPGSNVINKMLSISSNNIVFHDGTTQGTAGIPLNYMGNASGVATLDAGGKVPSNQLPAGAMSYQGSWDASTNTPTLINGSGTAGWTYSVSVGGTVNFGAGPIIFNTGDYAAYNGSIWSKITGSVNVVSFNTRTGAVVLSAGDVSTALGYTPYNGTTNPNGYVNTVAAGAAAPVQSVFGRTGSVVLTSNDVTAALTPGSLVNSKLANSNIIIGSTTLALGSTTTSIAGLSSLSVTGNITASNANLGNVATANYFSGNLQGAVTNAITVENVPGSSALTIDFTGPAIVHMKYNTDITISFSNITAGKIITLIAKNTNNGGRDVVLGVPQYNNTNNTSATPTITVAGNRIAVIRYICVGTTTADIYAEISYG